MEFLWALIDLSNAMALYILLGLLLAGILHEAVPGDFVRRHLGQSGIKSVIKATLLGAPIPICSCGVIPLAASLQKSGASAGAVLSFLISAPITGIDSILATYGIFGMPFTIYRVISSVFIAIMAGILVNIFDKKKPRFFQGDKRELLFHPDSRKRAVKKPFSIKRALHYAFFVLLKDISGPLFWGLVAGAAITVMIPDEIGEFLKNHTALSYLLAILIAVPMYVCATASLPIAAALVIKGAPLGAAFIFLTAGPATNTVTIAVVKKMLGLRATLIYLGSIAAGSLLFAVILDYFFHLEIKGALNMGSEGSLADYAASLLLWGFIGYFMLFGKKECEA